MIVPLEDNLENDELYSLEEIWCEDSESSTMKLEDYKNMLDEIPSECVIHITDPETIFDSVQQWKKKAKPKSKLIFDYLYTPKNFKNNK